jgi:transcription antitermination factor NusG
MLDAVTSPALDASATARQRYAGRGKAGRGTDQLGHDHPQCHCNSPRSGWIVVCTHPQAERWADANLRRSGFRTYLPLYAAKRRDPVLHTLTRVVQRPLFSGYVFCWHDSRDSWRPVYETPGVRGVIKNGNQIQWVRAGAVEAVRAAEAARRCPTAETAEWAPGVPCSLALGPLAGTSAVVVSVGADMALVAMMMFGELREVAVQLDCLRPRDE